MIVIYEDTNGDQYRIKNVKDMIYNPDQEEFIITFKNDKFMNIILNNGGQKAILRISCISSINYF